MIFLPFSRVALAALDGDLEVTLPNREHLEHPGRNHCELCGIGHDVATLDGCSSWPPKAKASSGANPGG